MRRLPYAVREALRTTFEEWAVTLEPTRKRVTMRAPDGTTIRVRVDMNDGFDSPIVLNGRERTHDVIRALGVVFDHAPLVLDTYETAGEVALREGAQLGREHHLRIAGIMATMRAHARALDELEGWRLFHTVLGDLMVDRGREGVNGASCEDAG